MPDPEAGEALDTFMDRCIPQIMDEGVTSSSGEHRDVTESKEAYAICRSMYERGQGEKEGRFVTIDDKPVFVGGPGQGGGSSGGGYAAPQAVEVRGERVDVYSPEGEEKLPPDLLQKDLLVMVMDGGKGQMFVAPKKQAEYHAALTEGLGLTKDQEENAVRTRWQRPVGARTRHMRVDTYFSVPYEGGQSSYARDSAAERRIKRAVRKMIRAGFPEDSHAVWNTAAEGQEIQLRLSDLKALDVHTFDAEHLLQPGTEVTLAISPNGSDLKHELISANGNPLPELCLAKACHAPATWKLTISDRSLHYCDDCLEGAVKALKRHDLKLDGIKSLKEAEKEGRFVTIDDKPVFVGGPGQGGGGASGSAGGASAETEVSLVSGRDRELGAEQVQALKEEIAGWPAGDRQSYAHTAVSEYDYVGASLMTLREGGEMKGVASLSMPYKKRNILAGTEEWSGDLVSVYHLATKERGYGKKMMRNIAAEAAKHDWTLAWNATDDSMGFYKALGFEPTTEKGFRVGPDKLKTFLEETKAVTLTDEELAELEPENGVFAVRPEGEQGDKAGRFVTIDDQPIFVGGPGQGGGSAGGGLAGGATEQARIAGQFRHDGAEDQINKYIADVRQEAGIDPEVKAVKMQRAGKYVHNNATGKGEVHLDRDRDLLGPNAATVAHECGHAYDYQVLNGAWDRGNFELCPQSLREANTRLAEVLSQSPTYQKWCELAASPKDAGGRTAAKWYKTITQPGETFAIVFGQHFTSRYEGESDGSKTFPSSEFEAIDKAIVGLLRAANNA